MRLESKQETQSSEVLAKAMESVANSLPEPSCTCGHKEHVHHSVHNLNEYDEQGHGIWRNAHCLGIVSVETKSIKLAHTNVEQGYYESSYSILHGCSCREFKVKTN